jgi:hypothetical protein
VCDISFSLDISRDFNSANPALNADVVVFEPLPAFGTNENNSKLFPPGGVASTSFSSLFFFFVPKAASSFWYGSEYTKQLFSFSSPLLVSPLVFVVVAGLLGTGVIFILKNLSLPSSLKLCFLKS